VRKYFNIDKFAKYFLRFMPFVIGTSWNLICYPTHGHAIQISCACDMWTTYVVKFVNDSCERESAVETGIRTTVCKINLRFRDVRYWNTLRDNLHW